jgi:putative ABC transport system permease protein
VVAVPGLWPDLPRAGELRVDLPALGFAVFASLLAALLAGGLPAWRAARLDPRAAFLDGPRVTEDRSARRSRNALVVAEVALTLVLLAGAGLLVRSVAELRGADPGFDARGVVVAPVFLDGEAYGSGEKSRAYYARLFERLRAIPGVVGVGGATTLPASPRGPGFDRPVWPAGAEGDERRIRHAAVRMVTPGYFDTLSIPVVAGRAFDERDGPNAPPVLAVSQTLARALWPAGDAVGRSLVVDYSTNGTYPYEVVAVVGDVRFQGPRSEPKAEIYLPHAQRPYLILNVAVRVEDAAGAAAAVRQALHETDPRIPPHGVHLLTDLLGATFARERLARGLLLGFAAIACLLSALGLYGMLAYRVQQRTAEIGVRLALGASPSRIVREVVREGARLVVLGAVLGAGGGALGLRLLRGLLYGVGPADPVAAAGALAVLALVSGLAVLRPAWLASRLDPARTLRRG